MAERISTSKNSIGAGSVMSGARQLFSVRQPEPARRDATFIAALVLRLVAVGLLIWIGWVHWHLWAPPPGGGGYKFIPRDGPFFLVDAVAGVVLGIMLLAWPRPLLGLLSAGFVASTIAALAVSLTVGLFGFNESIHASFVVQALVFEIVALIVLLAWTVLASGLVSGRTERSG